MVKNEMNYTDGELLLIELVDGKRGITSNELTELYYKTLKKKPPIHPRQSVVAMLRTLNAKLEHYSEAFKICHSERLGPNPSKYWTEKKAKK